MLLDGLHIPLTTPFHPDGRLALHKLASNVARYSKTPAAGLIILGPSGEPTLLSDDETREVLRTAAESAAPEKVLIAGISRDSVSATIAFADFAAEQQYDAALVAAPSVLYPQEHTRELFNYFRTLADHSTLPILLSSTAPRELPLDAIAGLAQHPNILGLFTSTSATEIAAIVASAANVRREATVTAVFAPVTTRMKHRAAQQPQRTLISAASLGNAATAIAEPPAISPQLRTRTKTVGFQIIAAQTRQSLDALRAGASALAPAFAAAAPQACYEVLAAWKDSDQPLAEEKQARIIAAAHLTEASPAALKYACDLNGYFGGHARLPYLPLTLVQREAIEFQMKDIRN
jgi:4-hydroxy-2-oxoglutarate aldolase